MEIKIRILAVVTLFSCNGIKESNMDKVLTIDLVGKWHMVSQGNNNVETKCNVCPEIEFVKDGKSKIAKLSKEIVDFTYTFDTDGKKINFLFEDKQSYFEGKEYFYKTHTEDNLEILELSSKVETSKYTLSRER